VVVAGIGPGGRPAEAVARARRRLLAWHQQFSRFDPDSELSQLNRDPRETVPVSAVMARFVAAALDAAKMTGGLVDPTLVGELETAGYRDSLSAVPISPPAVTGSSSVTGGSPAGPSSAATWTRIEVDRRAQTVTRPPGVRLDSGGIVKGMFGDILGSVLSGHESFAIDAAGDVRFGGTGSAPRPIQVAGPFDQSVLHVFELVRGAAATSAIVKRSWMGPDGRPAHHLLDPATGQPAFTGIVQATALAPTATEAEALSKAALLSGPDGAPQWLRHGGLVVGDDGGIEVVPPPSASLGVESGRWPALAMAVSE
jgi:FAD:protein FMN transferase